MSEGKMNYERERAQREYEERVRRHAAELRDGEKERFYRVFAVAGALMALRGLTPQLSVDMAVELEVAMQSIGKDPA